MRNLILKMINNCIQIAEFLDYYGITITGVMSLTRANPALKGMIDMYHKLKDRPVAFVLVLGNGGIGEVQGVPIFEKR
ncbi:hypothetical protein H1D32_16615 [Anaerobacillus sp. CMMVII]|uniref:hypothetical protein n=1 Tax=Anaerobacillus sp. CMMVII TaxID=2755588 RepID=UPI0021B7D314|nr:hypothetical protein [Anaerobacillus sp. CMMVII]MCT8139183.1 hypothetical protein [Anaerobacillus sp. CMMVII]